MNRRRFLQSSLASAAVSVNALRLWSNETDSAPASRMGLVSYCCNWRRSWLRQQNANQDLFSPRRFQEHCLVLGAGGMQASLGLLGDDEARAIREETETHDLYIEASISPPSDERDVTRFEQELKTAALTGASVARSVVMPGRRYEQFKSLQSFKEAEKRAEKMLRLAIPAVEATGVALAIENHKDQRIEERVELLRRLDHPLIGACVDTGNSIALLEDPLETVQALAPYARAVHLKDQAVQPCETGFLLGDIPLGQGCIDLKRVVEVLRTSPHRLRFSLELITRDPLLVPCLSPDYWTTLPNVSGKDLARALHRVSESASQELQAVNQLSLADRVALEDKNVSASLKYARDHLGL